MRLLIIGTLLVTTAFVGPALARSPHGGRSSVRHSNARSTPGDHVVHAYVRHDGTYVQSYHATNPNGTKNDNYSTRGNTNPYTGEAGTKPADGESPQ